MNNKTSVTDFLTKQIIQHQNEQGVSEVYTKHQDTYNWRDVSLFSTYAALWRHVNEVDLQVAPNSLAVENTFELLATFPFKSVTTIMTDYVRTLIRKQLGILFLPYTKKQLEALTNLLTQYPTNPIDKQRIEEIQQLRENIDTGLTTNRQREGKDKLAIYKPLKHYVATLTRKLYELPETYLWFVAEPLIVLYREVKAYADNDTSVDAAIVYLQKYREKYPTVEATFDAKIVDDVTSLLIFSYPHPEVVIAFERVLQVLELYYDPIKRRRLFVDDVEYKIKRYISNAERKLGKELIDWFRNKLNKSTDINLVDDEEDINTLSADKVYQLFLQALNHYQVTGKDKVEVVQLAEVLKKRPYLEVQHLPAFTRNMTLVDQLLTF